MQWLKKIIVRYLTELANDCNEPVTDIDYRADRMIDEIQRVLNARADFKEEK